MKSVTQKKKLLTKKQEEFYDFVEEKVMPFFEVRQYTFDMVNPHLQADEWYGKKILIILPYGEKMEPWLARVVSECYAYPDKDIFVVMGAKVNTNVWHKYVFPLAEEISFVRKGKRPAAIVRYRGDLEQAAFNNKDVEDIYSSIGTHKIDAGALIFHTTPYVEES